MKTYAYGKAPVDIAAVRNSKKKRIYKKPLKKETYESLEDLTISVSELTLISVYKIIGPSRKREITEARQIVMYIARENKMGSFQFISNYFNRTHTAVLSAHEVVGNLLTTDKIFREKFKKVAHLLK